MSIKLISAITLNSAAASIEFTNIPGTYDDLLLLTSLRNTRIDQGPRSVGLIEFNGSSSNLSYRRLYGIPGIATSSDNFTINIIDYATGNAATSNAFGNGMLYISNYTRNINKISSSDSVGAGETTSVGVGITSNIWNNTGTITSIRIFDTGYNYMTNSSAYLYGVTKGSDGITTVS